MEFYGLPPIGQKQRRPMDGAQFHSPWVGNAGGELKSRHTLMLDRFPPANVASGTEQRCYLSSGGPAALDWNQEHLWNTSILATPA
jgi:hypothetical protein